MDTKLIAGSAIAGLGCTTLHFAPIIGGNEPPGSVRYIAKVTGGGLAIIAGTAAVSPTAAKVVTAIFLAAGATTVGVYLLEHHLNLPVRKAYERGRNS